MADTNWIEIYRTYTPEELAAEIASLKEWSAPVASQGAGEKSYTKEANFGARLASACRVQSERSGNSPGAVGIPDFSKIQVGGGDVPSCLPVGTKF